jgi:NAD(P)H-hydrate repair Nnr-like enzyme with NAD(P)H-hydrate epimerase domain
LLPLLTTAQMREADAVAVTKRGVEALVSAAGTAVGLEAKRMLRRVYGSRIAVVVGPGLNGSDGRVAASWLRSRGAVVDVIEVARQPLSLDGFHLVIWCRASTPTAVRSLVSRWAPT